MAAVNASCSGCAASLVSLGTQAARFSKARSAALLGSPALLRRGIYNPSSLVVHAAGPGGNVLDKPSILPGFGKEKDVQRRKPPIYRVLLHNDNYNRREYVVKVLLKVVEGFTVDEAVNCMQEAHVNGVGLVTMCAQEQAERYVESLRLNGLISTLEPAGPGK